MKRLPLGVWLFAALIASITSLPYAVGYASTPPGWSYSGAPALPGGTIVDYNSYMSAMWLGKQGEWRFQLLATHEPQPGVLLLKWFNLALGQLAGLTSLSLPLVYHAARFLLTAIFVLVLWAFASLFFETAVERWTCLVFATVVGGWSWLILLFPTRMRPQDISPIEFWLIDAFNLLGVFFAAHFAAALVLQIMVVLSLHNWIKRGGLRWLVILTAALAAESFMQPYVIPLLGPLVVFVAAYHVVHTHQLLFRRALLLTVPLAVHAGLTLYQYLALKHNPVTAKFIATNITMSPPVIFYVLGYLPFLIPIGFGIRPLLAQLKADDRWVLVLMWVGIVILLLYAPLNTQRRYLIGFQTPLAVLATVGWTRGILPRLAPRRRPLVTIVYVALGTVALLLMFLGNAVALAQPRQHPDAFYQVDERRAYRWLEQEAEPGGVVFTVSNSSGGPLLAATGRRVFIGSWFETVDYSEKIEQVKHFYDPATSDVWRRELLSGMRATYVWYDRDARQAGEWNPAGADFLEPVFQSDTVTIYRVQR